MLTIFLHAVFAIVLAIGFGLVLSAVFSIRPWAAPWAVFLVLFLLIWAGGVWMTPVGPPFLHIYWVPFVLMGLVVVLLFAAGTERPRRSPSEALDDIDVRDHAAEIGVTAFFWLLVAALVAAIFIHYFAT